MFQTLTKIKIFVYTFCAAGTVFCVLASVWLAANIAGSLTLFISRIACVR